MSNFDSGEWERNAAERNAAPWSDERETNFARSLQATREQADPGERYITFNVTDDPSEDVLLRTLMVTTPRRADTN